MGDSPLSFKKCHIGFIFYAMSLKSVAALELPARREVEAHFVVTKADKGAWPALPQGVLAPRASEEKSDPNVTAAKSEEPGIIFEEAADATG